MLTTLDDLLVLPDTEKERLRAGLSQLPSHEQQAVAKALVHQTLARCEEDGLFWLRFVQTRDEADPLQSVKPFPISKEYIHSIWAVLVDKQRIVIAKSRQMLASWILCAFCVWWARFHPNQAIYWQTQRAEDANEKVSLPVGDRGSGYLGRMQFIEHHLPVWMRVGIKETEGTLSYANGSLIQALAGGANQIRGKVGSIIVQDEFAYQEESRGVYVAVAPLIQKHTKFVAISTPNGMDNIFAEIYHGYRVIA